MNSPQPCPLCLSGWLIQSGDIFCGYCGQQVINVRLGEPVQVKDKYYLHEEWEAGEIVFRIMLQNDGALLPTPDELQVRIEPVGE